MRYYCTGDTINIVSPETLPADQAELTLYTTTPITVGPVWYESGRYHFEIDLTTTPPGEYNYKITVTRSGKQTTLITDQIRVIDPATHDTRSPARKMLDLIDAYLLDPTNTKYQSESIAGVSITRYSLSELHEIRRELRREISRERSRKRFTRHRF